MKPISDAKPYFSSKVCQAYENEKKKEVTAITDFIGTTHTMSHNLNLDKMRPSSSLSFLSKKKSLDSPMNAIQPSIT